MSGPALDVLSGPICATFFFRRTGLDVLSGLSYGWSYLGHILGISLAYLGHTLGISRAYLVHILGISWIYLGISQACFPMCSNVFKTCSSVFKCVQMCLNIVQMCSNLFKTCSNVLVLSLISGDGWVFRGNGCFLAVKSDYECIWGEYSCFLGFQVVMGVFGWSLGG